MSGTALVVWGQKRWVTQELTHPTAAGDGTIGARSPPITRDFDQRRELSLPSRPSAPPHYAPCPVKSLRSRPSWCCAPIAMGCSRWPRHGMAAGCSGSIRSGAACCRWIASICRGGCCARCCRAEFEVGGRSRLPGHHRRLRHRRSRGGRTPGSARRSSACSPSCTAWATRTRWNAGTGASWSAGCTAWRSAACSLARACSASSRDASKAALAHLVARLRLGGFRLLDTQFVTAHLAQFGAEEIPRDTYRAC